MCDVNEIKLDDVLREIHLMLQSKTPIERAELIIRQYCEMDDPSEKTTRLFNEWLQLNAETALQTDALALYFDKLLVPVIPDSEIEMKVKGVIQEILAAESAM